MLPSTPRIFIGSTTLTVRGLRSRHCQAAVTARIAKIPGVTAVHSEPAIGTITVFVDAPVDRADIDAALRDAGHPAVP